MYCLSDFLSGSLCRKIQRRRRPGISLLLLPWRFFLEKGEDHIRAISYHNCFPRIHIFKDNLRRKQQLTSLPWEKIHLHRVPQYFSLSSSFGSDPPPPPPTFKVEPLLCLSSLCVTVRACLCKPTGKGENQKKATVKIARASSLYAVNRSISWMYSCVKFYRCRQYRHAGKKIK